MTLRTIAKRKGEPECGGEIPGGGIGRFQRGVHLKRSVVRTQRWAESF